MTTDRLRRILFWLRLFKDCVEIVLVGIVAYMISCAGPLDMRPVSLALLVLASVGIDARDHLRRLRDL